MKYDIQVCPRCGLAVVRLTGSADGDDLCRVLRALVDEEDWDPTQDDLWDLRALSDLFISPDQVPRLTACVPSEERARSGGRTALVTRTLTQRAYATIFVEAINPSGRVRRSFRSEGRAARWLATHARRETNGRPCGRACLLTHVGGVKPTRWEWT